MNLLFTVKVMILAQVVLITPIVIGNMESYVEGISGAIKETAKGLVFQAMAPPTIDTAPTSAIALAKASRYAEKI